MYYTVQQILYSALSFNRSHNKHKGVKKDHWDSQSVLSKIFKIKQEWKNYKKITKITKNSCKNVNNLSHWLIRVLFPSVPERTVTFRWSADCVSCHVAFTDGKKKSKRHNKPGFRFKESTAQFPLISWFLPLVQHGLDKLPAVPCGTYANNWIHQHIIGKVSTFVSCFLSGVQRAG